MEIKSTRSWPFVQRIVKDNCLSSVLSQLKITDNDNQALHQHYTQVLNCWKICNNLICILIFQKYKEQISGMMNGHKMLYKFIYSVIVLIFPKHTNWAVM